MYDSNTSKLFGLKLSRTEPSRTEPNIFASKIRGVGHIMVIYGFWASIEPNWSVNKVKLRKT